MKPKILLHQIVTNTQVLEVEVCNIDAKDGTVVLILNQCFSNLNVQVVNLWILFEWRF